MAEFFSNLGSGIKNNFTPDPKKALSRKIDDKRNQFIKGISSNRFSKKEDPTYLHFKFIFDFAIGGEIDPETFLAPSPLFRDADPNDEEVSKYIRDVSATRASQGTALSPEEAKNIEERGGFATNTDFFYGSKFQAPGLFGNGAFPMHSPISYLGAQEFLGVRSSQRKAMMKGFKNALDFINRKCPHYFQSLSGLETLLKTPISNYHKAGSALKRAGTLQVDCLESIDMRISAMAELYRKSIYDYTNHRVMLPENLRKFRMWLVVTEIRNIQLKQGGIDDLLNPFSIPSVAQGANFLENFSSQSGLLGEIFNNEDPSERPGAAEFGSYEMMPYAWVYQFDKCEFDFDETYPFGTSIDNKGNSTPVSTKFSIHVGSVKDYKIQFNELSDLLQKQDGIKKMVINDTWNPNETYTKMDYSGNAGIENLIFSDKNNPADYFASLASNFIMNSAAGLKNVGVSMLQNKLLGNIYGLGGIDPRNALNSVQSVIAQAKDGIPNPFAKNDPQSKGLGGPGQRQYPTINQDVYPDGAGNAAQGSLGNVLTGSQGAQATLKEDAYPNVPGTDLGLPDRAYQNSKDDQYKGVPGEDLGVPGRVYKKIEEDTYPGPDKVEYPGVSGKEYTPPTPPPAPAEDSVYKKDPIVYTDVKDDQYKDVPGQDLGLPDRNYPTIKPSEDVYKGTGDLGLPDRSYPDIKADEYPNPPNPPITNFIGDQYKNVPGTDLGLPDRSYPPVNGDDEYKNVPGTDLGIPDRSYPSVNGDVYKNVPGNDLGLPSRIYESSRSEPDAYKEVPGTDLGVPRRIYPPTTGDVYKNVPGEDLGLPKRVYGNNSSEGDAYTGVPGPDLGVGKRAYPPADGDVYKESPGSDLGLPKRIYPNSSVEGDQYPGVPGSDLGVPGRRYPGI